MSNWFILILWLVIFAVGWMFASTEEEGMAWTAINVLALFAYGTFIDKGDHSRGRKPQ